MLASDKLSHLVVTLDLSTLTQLVREWDAAPSTKGICMEGGCNNVAEVPIPKQRCRFWRKAYCAHCNKNSVVAGIRLARRYWRDQ